MWQNAGQGFGFQMWGGSKVRDQDDPGPAQGTFQRALIIIHLDPCRAVLDHMQIAEDIPVFRAYGDAIFVFLIFFKETHAPVKEFKLMLF